MWTKWKLARLILSSKSFFIHSLKTFITVQCSFFPVQSGAKKWNQIFSFILFSIYLIFQVKRVNFSAPSPSFTKENGQLKSLLSGRLHMSNWFFSAIMDGSGLCIPIRLKNAWGRNLLQIRGARSSQGKKCCDDQSRCSKIKSSDFLRPRFCGAA